MVPARCVSSKMKALAPCLISPHFTCFLLPSWALNAKTKNGHQQGAVIDGADICGCTFQVLRNITSPSAVARVTVCLALSLIYGISTQPPLPFTPSLSLFICLPQRKVMLKPLSACLPAVIYAAPYMHFDAYVLRERASSIN